MSESSNMASQPVVFTTVTQFPLPTQKFMIPTSWKRFQLSQLVNKALSLDKPVPFDFLVRGALLHTSLAEWCSQNDVGEEETLEIEYIESIMPPTKISDIPHDDWVSSISCQIRGFFLTASYDGHIRAFDYSKNLISDILAHSAPITSICFVSSSHSPVLSDSSVYKVASSSHDHTAQITQVTLPGPPSSKSPFEISASLHLHTSPVSSIASNSPGSHLLTSSWDGLIGLWDTSIPSSDEVPEPATNERDRKKRRRVEGDPKPRRKAPLSVLKSHTARVSKVQFGLSTTNKAYSCGLDSTVRIWDTELGVCEHTISASERPFLDLAVTPDGLSLLATSTDKTVSLYDLRSTSLTVSAGAFLHPATPSCVVVCESNSHQVATGSYDGIVRVWDLRSMKSAMATFQPWDGTKKVLSVDWKRDIVGVGGEGGFEIWKVGEEKASQA